MTDFSGNSCSNCSKLQENDQKYRRFISKLSHEIRNPLTLIYSSLQFLEQDCPAVTQTDLWPQIKQDLKTTLNLLNDVSALNKQHQLRKDVVWIETFLSDIAASVSSMMKSRDISFQLKMDPDIYGTAIFADEGKLREVILNLLVNAADAVSADTVPSGNSTNSAESTTTSKSSDSAPAQILLTGQWQGTLLCIHIKDNGCGIPEEYHSTLFDPFVTHKTHGTGLGLNIVKNIVEQHGGTITFQTSTAPEQSYTDFCLTIPA